MVKKNIKKSKKHKKGNQDNYFKNLDPIVKKMCSITTDRTIDYKDIEDKYINNIVLIDGERLYKEPKKKIIPNNSKIEKKLTYEKVCFITKNNKTNKISMDICKTTDQDIKKRKNTPLLSVDPDDKDIRKLLTNNEIEIIGTFHTHPFIDAFEPSDSDLLSGSNLYSVYESKSKTFPECIGYPSYEGRKIFCYGMKPELLEELKTLGYRSFNKIDNISEKSKEYVQNITDDARKKNINLFDGEIIMMLEKYQYDPKKKESVLIGYFEEYDPIDTKELTNFSKKEYKNKFSNFYKFKEIDCNKIKK